MELHLGPHEALAVMDALSACCTCDGTISFCRSGHLHTVKQLLLRLLSRHLKGLISTEPPVDLRHKCSFLYASF